VRRLWRKHETRRAYAGRETEYFIVDGPLCRLHASAERGDRPGKLDAENLRLGLDMVRSAAKV
jgi:hypothetical protein